MSNYSKENLITVPKKEVNPGDLAVKIGDEIFVCGKSMQFYKCASVDTASKTWTGYKAVLKDGGYSFETELTEGLFYGDGFTPVAGKIFDADTLVRVVSLLSKQSGKLVLLCHFDSEGEAIDETGKCTMTVEGQASVDKDAATTKFGSGRFYSNYNNWTEASVKIDGLPELDAFTIEYWKQCTSAVQWGGRVVHNTSDRDNVLTASADTPVILNEYFHHAFVREAGSDIVTEYINGKQAATVKFSVLLGGQQIRWTCGGNAGTSAGYGDELAIWDYPRYVNDFDVPTEPYNVDEYLT